MVICLNVIYKLIFKRNLKEKIMHLKDKDSSLHEKHVIYWFYKIILGLEQLHSRNVIHKQVCKE